jgi:hypothetical protein
MAKKMKAPVVFICEAPDDLFVSDLSQLPAELMRAVTKQGGLPCAGSGVASHWCNQCRWGKQESAPNILLED